MPTLEQINPTTYKIVSGRDAIEVSNIDDVQCLAHLKVKRWHGNSEFVLSYPGSPTGLIIVDMTNGIIKIPYGDVDVELTAHDPDGENPDGRGEFNLILNSKPTPDANGEYWQVLDFGTVGINLSRVLGLDEEWSQERCYEEWYADLYDNHQGNDLYGHDDGTGIFVRTPTEIRTPDGEVVLKSKPEHLVHSIRGTAIKNNHYKSELGEIKTPDSPYKGKQLTYTRVSRDHLILPKRELEDKRGNRARIEDIQLDGNQIKFKLPKAFIDKAKYPVSHVTGLDPAYTEDMDSWVTDYGSDDTWEDYDIFTNHSVPKGAVAEIIIANQENGVEAQLGIRTDGSGLARRLWIHEAEGGGVTTCRMFVLVDASTGLVETWADDVSDVNIFYLVGYWENVGFTEAYSPELTASYGAWVDRILSDSGAASRVCHFTAQTGSEVHRIIGVRANGSSLERKVLLHEAEGGGASFLDMLVKADANYTIEHYREDSYVGNYLLGYFGSEMDFVELFQDITANNIWTTRDLTAYLDEDGRVVDFLLGFNFIGAEHYLGVRDGDDSTTARYILEHEAEDDGGSTGEITGFGMSAKTNASGEVQNYCGAANNDQFYLMGYFKPGVVVQDYPISLSPGLTVSSTVAYAVAWDRGMSPGLTASATVVKGWGRKITTSPGLTVAVTIVKAFGRLIATTANLTVSATVAKLVAYKRGLSLGLTASAIVARKVAFKRTTSPGLTVAVTVARAFGKTFVTTANLTISTTISRAVAYKRAISADLTVAVTVVKGWGRTKATTANLTVSATIAMSKGFVRSLSPGLTVSSTVARALAYKRATASGLTASVTIARKLAYKRATQVVLSIAVSIVRSMGRIITTSPGLTISATVVKSWGRTITTSTALAVSATVNRVVAFAKSLTPGLTASITVDREVAYNRATSPGLTAAIIIVKSFGKKIATSTSLAISTTIDRTVAYSRATQSALSVSATIVKSWGRKIITSAGLTVSTTVSRVVAYKRAVSAGLTIATTIIATLVTATHYLITVVSNLTVSTAVNRVVAYKRAVLSNLAVSATISRAVAYKRAVSSGLTVAVTIIKSWGTTITTSPGLTVAVTISKSFGKKIATTTALAVNVIVAKQVAYTRSISTGITTAVSVARSWGITRATTTNLALSTTISRVIAYKRAIQPALSVTVTVLRSLGRTIITSPVLSVSTAISRSMSYKRATSVGLTVVAVISRIVAYKRTISAGLTVSVTVARAFGKKITTAANLTVSVTIRYCTVLKGLYRLSIGRMAASRLPLGRLNYWRRRRKCE